MQSTSTSVNHQVVLTPSEEGVPAWLIQLFRGGWPRRRREQAADLSGGGPHLAVPVCKQPHAASQDVAVLQLHFAGPQGCDPDA